MRINFSEQWDKLKTDRFKVGSTFTTFRGYSPQKHNYYRKNKDMPFTVVLNDKIIGEAILKTVTARWANHLRIDEIKKDTYEYYNCDDFDKLMIKFYGNSSFIGLWLVFKIYNVIGVKA